MIRYTKTAADYRKRQKWSQAQVAAKIGTDQSRVARLESGATGISLDFGVRTLAALGLNTKEIAKVVAGGQA